MRDSEEWFERHNYVEHEKFGLEKCNVGTGAQLEGKIKLSEEKTYRDALR